MVKVHESTLRRRLNEFGETPASQLTLDEFMNVDMDAMTEEQDPPSYKAAREKDRERLEVMESETDIDGELTDLEERIERGLDERRGAVTASQDELDSLLMPPPAAARQGSSLPCAPGLGLKDTVQEYLQPAAVVKVHGQEEEEELDLSGIDEDEIDSYIMTAAEIKQKTTLWLRVNSEYLEEQALKIKREEEEREEMIR